MRYATTALIIFILAGCSPYASYPPVENTAAVTDPTFEPVPTVIATALEWARVRESGSTADDALNFTLPAGSAERAYEKIEDRIPGAARATPGTPAIDIKSIRVRGFDATVDVTIPREGRNPMLYTLTLKSMPFEQWKVIGERRWRFTQKALERSGAWTSEQGESDMADANGE